MNSAVLKKIQSKMSDKKVPNIEPGYTIEVSTVIREGNKQRTQKFRGLVIAVSGNGTDKMVTVRKISNGFGVEKKLPVYSSNISDIKVIKKEGVRRSKLYFMRSRVGKSAMRVKRGKAVFVTEEGESQVEAQETEAIPFEEVVETPEVVEAEVVSEEKASE